VMHSSRLGSLGALTSSCAASMGLLSLNSSAHFPWEIFHYLSL
jgi:hypothetical protein